MQRQETRRELVPNCNIAYNVWYFRIQQRRNHRNATDLDSLSEASTRRELSEKDSQPRTAGDPREDVTFSPHSPPMPESTVHEGDHCSCGSSATAFSLHPCHEPSGAPLFKRHRCHSMQHEAGVREAGVREAGVLNICTLSVL